MARTDKQDKPQETPPPSNAGGAKGQSVSPVSDTQPAPAEPGPGKAIPIGVPVSPEEFRKLKEQAEVAAEETSAIETIPIGVPVSPEEFRKLKERARAAEQPQQDAPEDEDETA
mgnify:CR=1 FL=1